MLNKRIMIVVASLLVAIGITFGEEPLTKWGSWQDIDANSEFRTRIVRYNSYVKKYSWEVEVRNNSNKEMHISMAMTPEGESSPPATVFGGNNIDAGDSYVFTLVFCDAGPGERVRLWWKNIRYE